MSTRLGLQRILDFFRQNSLDECEFVLGRARKIYDERVAAQRKSAKSQAAAASTPRRTRRTKAQIAADKAALGEHKSARGETIPAVKGHGQTAIEEGARAAGASGSITV